MALFVPEQLVRGFLKGSVLSADYWGRDKIHERFQFRNRLMPAFAANFALFRQHILLTPARAL
jgi:hypothetical protein